MRGGRAPQAEEAASAGTASLPCLIHLGLPDHHFLPPHLGQQARAGISGFYTQAEPALSAHSYLRLWVPQNSSAGGSCLQKDMPLIP